MLCYVIVTPGCITLQQKSKFISDLRSKIYFSQEHEQGQEEPLSKKRQGKKWIIWEEKQQQEEKHQQVLKICTFKLGGGVLRR